MVVFQLSSDERKNLIIGLIKKYASWARITDNVWCLKTEIEESSGIRHQLANGIGIKSDERFTTPSWASYNLPKEVTEWLK